ncbi:MAG: hypothetical protein ACO1TE_23385 [Prosthecobacter sp.]
METDLQLLFRYHRQGDGEAFQSLVEAHAGMVHATARRVTQKDAWHEWHLIKAVFRLLGAGSSAPTGAVEYSPG